jgi:hypothetical protein
MQSNSNSTGNNSPSTRQLENEQSQRIPNKHRKSLLAIPYKQNRKIVLYSLLSACILIITGTYIFKPCKKNTTYGKCLPDYQELCNHKYLYYSLNALALVCIVFAAKILLDEISHEIKHADILDAELIEPEVKSNTKQKLD